MQKATLNLIWYRICVVEHILKAQRRRNCKTFTLSLFFCKICFDGFYWCIGASEEALYAMGRMRAEEWEEEEGKKERRKARKTGSRKGMIILLLTKLI